MSAEQHKHASSWSILIVGLTNDVVARITACARPLGIEARATSLAKLQDDTAKYRPIVVFVDGYLYDFDPSAFDKLAQKVGAKLAVVSNAKEAETMLAQLLCSPPAPPASSARQTEPPPSRREFETAKYDTKTLHDALARMQPPRPEFQTAKYDAKTLHEALERMSPKRLDGQTAMYDPETLEAMLDEVTAKRGGFDTGRYDAKTLEAVIEAMSSTRGDSKPGKRDEPELEEQDDDEL